MPADYSGQRVRGRSFKGQDLTGANFSGADIRGANFTNAILIGANFSHVKAGLQKRWVAFLLIGSFLMSGVSGFYCAFAGALVSLIFDSSQSNQIAGWVTLVILIIFFVLIIRQGFNSAVTGAFAGAFVGAGAVAGTVAGAFAGAFAVAGAFAFAGAFAVALSSAGAGALALVLTGVAALSVAVPLSVAGAFAFTLLSTYITWRALFGDEKYALIRSWAIAFAAFGGTSFRNANLTDANFTGAILKSTDFRKATITRTRFHQSKKLDRVCPGTTYLEQFELLNVLVTGIGTDKNFDHKDLKGVNLQGANLTDASFIGANLSEANLQDADLSRAKLAVTQLDSTDFTGATLTGAYIEDWGITNGTKFDGVRCGYVYMQLPTKENPDPMRKPDNREEVFGDGEFGDFIKPIFDTLDLYHSQGVDPRAMAIAFKELAENHPEAELEIVAMEKRGRDKFLLRATTAADADKSQLNAEYFDTYNHIKSLPEQEIKLLLAEQDSRMHNLENMLQTALKGSNYNAKIILILAANPTTASLRLDEEVREIDIGLQRAKKRDMFELKHIWAVRARDFSKALLDFKPQIVHFCGHGSGEDGLVLESENGEPQFAETEALVELFKLFNSHVECVILNACYSEIQAAALAQHIPYVVGMNKAIGDRAAIEFSVNFYTALGAGESIEFAYNFGCNAVRLARIPEHLTPVLKKKNNSCSQFAVRSSQFAGGVER